MPHEIKKKHKKEKGKENGAALKLRDALRCHMIFNRVTNEYIVRSDQSRAKPDTPLHSPSSRAATTHNKSTNSWQCRCTSLTDAVGSQHGVYLTSDVVLCPRCPTSTSLALLLFDVLSLIGTLDDAWVGWLLMLPLLWLVRVRVAALIHAVPPPLLLPLPSIALYNSLTHTHTNLCIWLAFFVNTHKRHRRRIP